MPHTKPAKPMSNPSLRRFPGSTARFGPKQRRFRSAQLWRALDSAQTWATSGAWPRTTFMPTQSNHPPYPDSILSDAGPDLKAAFDRDDFRATPTATGFFRRGNALTGFLRRSGLGDGRTITMVFNGDDLCSAANDAANRRAFASTATPVNLTKTSSKPPPASNQP